MTGPEAAGSASAQGPATILAWLGPDLLLIVAEVPADVTYRFRSPGGSERFPARRFEHGVLVDGSPRGLLFSVDAHRDAAAPRISALVLEPVRPEPVAPLELDVLHHNLGLRALVREHLAGLDAPRRAALMRFLTTAADAHGVSITPELSESLHVARECLRERLPLSVGASDRASGLEIHQVLAADWHQLWISGEWKGATPSRLTAVSPEGWRIELLEELEWGHERARDLIGHLEARAFSCCFSSEVPAVLRSGWVFEVETSVGELLEVHAPDAVHDVSAIADALLTDRLCDSGGSLARRVAFLRAAQDARATRVRVSSLHRFGRPSAVPEVSVIVVAADDPAASIEQQLAQFCDDPDFRRAEIIYVVDGARLVHEVLVAAAGLYDLYRLPFQIVMTDPWAGPEASVNAAAAVATAPRLLLLHPDVLPSKPGWLGAMATFHQRPGVGAIGVRLLYEDDALHHAGIWVEGSGETWRAREPLKSLHRDVATDLTPQLVPAVGGGCLLVETTQFRDQGGLRTTWLDGQTPEIDLCLRLRRAGCENWYLPSVTLYFLEERSLDREANLGGRSALLYATPTHHTLSPKR